MKLIFLEVLKLICHNDKYIFEKSNKYIVSKKKYNRCWIIESVTYLLHEENARKQAVQTSNLPFIEKLLG